MQPFKVVINSGNGAAGPAVDAINNKLKEKGVKTNFVFVHHDPDPTFPTAFPTLLEETDRRMPLSLRPDFGVLDGDFDRCFFFDQSGNFILGSMCGLLAEIFLNKDKGHDHPRPPCVWNTVDVVGKCSGHAVMSNRSYFVKAMRTRCGLRWRWRITTSGTLPMDSGIIPWL